MKKGIWGTDSKGKPLEVDVESSDTFPGHVDVVIGDMMLTVPESEVIFADNNDDL